MARVAISEYAAKKLVFGEEYTGFSVTPESLEHVVDTIQGDGFFIVKIDVGIKKRGKQGFIRLNVSKSNLQVACGELFALGFNRCVIEPMIPHEAVDERYVSIDLVRDGASVLYCKQGGVEIESQHDLIESFFVPRSEVLQGATAMSARDIPLSLLLLKMQEYHLSFMEINPFLNKNGTFMALDMAVEIDDAFVRKLPSWIEAHIIKKADSTAEKAVQKQAEATAASLTLKTLNENGSILTLLSGGGASLVAMDALVGALLQDQIINYSEYSGAPTRDETRVYVETLLQVLFASKAPKKVVVIAGGVANFTDILLTFQGVVDAFLENIKLLQQQNVYICIRRGGPNQEKGLAHLRAFLTEHKLAHDVYGPELSLGELGVLVKKHI